VVGADTLIEDCAGAVFRFEPLQFMLGASFNSRAIEPPTVGPQV
jgi:hypothetical protein